VVRFAAAGSSLPACTDTLQARSTRPQHRPFPAVRSPT
jgi:hypothetical protein